MGLPPHRPTHFIYPLQKGIGILAFYRAISTMWEPLWKWEICLWVPIVKDEWKKQSSPNSNRGMIVHFCTFEVLLWTIIFP